MACGGRCHRNGAVFMACGGRCHRNGAVFMACGGRCHRNGAVLMCNRRGLVVFGGVLVGLAAMVSAGGGQEPPGARLRPALHLRPMARLRPAARRRWAKRRGPAGVSGRLAGTAIGGSRRFHRAGGRWPGPTAGHGHDPKRLAHLFRDPGPRAGRWPRKSRSSRRARRGCSARFRPPRRRIRKSSRCSARASSPRPTKAR